MNDEQKLEKFALVWQGCGTDSEIARRFHVPGYEGYLPFFLWGEELAALERKESVELREEHLLKGILYGLRELEDEKKFWAREQDRNTYLHLLDILGRGFGFASPEKMILDVAFDLRGRNGNYASRAVLETGRILIPQSSTIKSDLIMDLWELFCQNQGTKELPLEIVELLPQVDLSETHRDAKEVICYYGFCATVLLGRQDDIEPFLGKYIYPNITYRSLKIKIKDLLENPSAFTPRELKVG